MSLRDDILSAPDLPIEPVAVPEWGQIVHIRAITSSERDAFDEGSLTDKKGKKVACLRNLRARLVVLAACKGPTDASPLFEPLDAVALGQKSGRALDRLYSVAARLAGIREEDVEEMAGN